MPHGSGWQASAILDVLADLSPSAQQQASGLTIPLDWFRWLPAAGVTLFLPPVMLPLEPQGTRVAQSVAIKRGLGEHLAALDRIRPGEQHSLRAGWLFVAGRRPLGDGRMQRVFHPLITVPVRIVLPPLLGDAQVWAAGDVSVTGLVADAARRHELEAAYELGGGALEGVYDPEIPSDLLRRLERLRRFATAAAEAAGFETRGLRNAALGPSQLLRSETLTIVAGVGLYTASEVGGLSPASALRTWAARSLTVPTAFEALYLGDQEPSEPREDAIGVITPFPLTPTQREAVSVSRRAAVSVVSGAPGTGKSHTVSAIACEAVGRGETVLVAAKSEAAVDALLVLLGEAPGPEPVVFGSSERRDELARRLAGGELRAADRSEVAVAADAVRQAVAERDAQTRSIVERLEVEAHLPLDEDALGRARLVGPALFDPTCDLSRGRDLLAVATRTDGWWARWRAERARRRAALLAGATAGATATELLAVLVIAERSRAAGDLVAAGGLDLTTDWTRLEEVEAQVHELAGRWLAVTSRSSGRLGRSSLEAVAVLGAALRSGRAARREQLTRLDQRLTRALPLWVGTLGDVEDLLPPTPALFDLVILDEASAIDQPLAAPALLRARRAVVVGDPHQLRHVSFLADEQLRRAAEEHGLDEDPMLVGRLDVRRNSLFDVAAGIAPPTILDEHFRSAPHLIDFVARRLYGGRLHVATRTPQTEACDRIEVTRMSGRRDRAGVVRTEVDAVLEHLQEMRRRGERSVGIVTPFRAQADALEAAVLDAFAMSDLEALDLRVGTVHAFQGNERDVVVVSLGIGEGDSATTWRFADDPHLFAVLATRARERMVLLLSADPPPDGLLADYLAQADAPPGPPRPAGAPSQWSATVAEWLQAAGTPATPQYPTGRHTVDVCAGDERRFLGLECTVHPDGPAAHIDRHLALRRAGWELADAYLSRWSHRQGELIVRLTERL